MIGETVTTMTERISSGKTGSGRSILTPQLLILSFCCISLFIFALPKDLPVRGEKTLPPDPPIPSLPMNGTEWTRTACILQPWGRSEMEIVNHAAEQIPGLKQRFGFNAVTLLPPAAHNAISGGSEITEAEFEEALRVFRANGFRIILYSSIMHCGHDPVWQDGTLTRIHPEWSQRGPEGEPITIYGHEWLCPSTGALVFTIAYTQKLVRRFQPDAVLLDNNEFYATPTGISCYCNGCQGKFREYLTRRFGKTVLGQPIQSIRIPKTKGPLYNIWLSCRNRIWAEATEKFRLELRRVKPGIAVMANTQYLFSSNSLATDRQYEHEDAVLSETTGLGLDALVDKLLLGKALAKDRPLWNYLGTFQTGDMNRLRTPEVVSTNVSATVALLARPWVVYYGFLENREINRPSLDRMAAVLSWHSRMDPEKLGLKPYAPVLSLASLDSFNFLGRPLIPPYLARLRRLGICSRIIEERDLAPDALASCRALLIDEAPCLSETSIRQILSFVSSGGILFARTDTSRYDGIGRLRPSSPLWKRLGSGDKPVGPVRFGRGTAIPFDGAFPVAAAAKLLAFARFTVTPETDLLILPYQDRKGEFFVYVCSERTLPATLKIRAPGNGGGRAVVCSPDPSEPQIIPLALP